MAMAPSSGDGSADAYVAAHKAKLEAAISRALARTFKEQPTDPLQRLVELLQCELPPHKSLAGIQAQIAQLSAQLKALAPEAEERAGGVEELRASLVASQNVVAQARAGVDQVVKVAPPTSRSGHLRTLEELIGPPPARSWKDEWDGWQAEMRGASHDPEKFGVEVYIAWGRGEGPLKKGWVHQHIEEVRSFGWPREAAELWRLLTLGRPMFARALRERDSCYAASTYALCEVLFRQRQRQVREGVQAEVPHAFYRHLDDPTGALRAHSLVADDPAWARIETPDATGFRGLTCSATLLVDSGPESFAEGGFCHPQMTGTATADAPVVLFESAPDDALGAHSPVLTGEHYAIFPPNTLFRLKRVEAPGTWEAPGGVRPRQRLLVVSATYQKPREGAAGGLHGGKLCESVVTLQYGSRDQFVRGLDDILARPSLSMAQEFARDHSWLDWRGAAYSLRGEWAYVNGPAACTPGCTPGTRDANNDGKMPRQFQDEANALIRSRRAEGCGVAMGERDAFLTLDEVLAVRLYSGPSYQPINAFLRAVATLRGDFRTGLAEHAGLTFAATVRCIIQAIRKLSAITTPAEACEPLWRGVRGELPPSFWLPDKAGMVAAVDMAFMSTSRNRQTPIDYMGEGDNVLWALQAQAESDAGYHRGADIGLLSQFAAEAEVLFPPCTMLTVQSSSKRESVSAPDGAPRGGAPMLQEGDRRFLSIEVLPTFV